MTASRPYPSRAKAYTAVVVLTVAYMLSFVDRQILSLLVEPMKRDLRITDFQASLLQGLAFAVIYCVAGVPLGRLADRFSRRTIIIGGVAVWSAMTTMCGFVRSFGALFFGRAGVGIGEASLTPAAYSLLSDYFAPDELPRAMAVYGLGPAVGTGLAYMLGGTILASVGSAGIFTLGFLGARRPWQMVFVLVGGLGIVVIMLLSLMSEAPRRSTAENVTAENAHEEFTFAQVLRFARMHRRGLGALTFGMAMMGLQAYGAMSWLPTMFMRTFAVAPGAVGLHMGAVYLVSSVSGSLAGAWCATHLRPSGTKNPYILWVLYCAVALTLSGVFAPLCPTATTAYVVCALMFGSQSAWAGVALSAVQLAAPNRMRATVTSMMLFCSNIIGLTLGPSGVAVLTQFVFGDPQSLKYSIAIISALGGSLAVIAFAFCLRSFPPLESTYAVSGIRTGQLGHLISTEPPNQGLG